MNTQETPSVVGFDLQESPEAPVLEFPEGFMGRHQQRRFALVASAISTSPFLTLISLDEPGVAYGIADPTQLFANYEVDLSEERGVLDIESDDEAKLYVVLTVGENPMRTTANLLAPLLVNTRTGIGRQLVLSDSRYSTKHPIIATRQQ